ncbi:hypothetical protein PUNSTDRAFT_48138 [Punctularia strigosozonata HHB-11173 SS5]|uniref:CCHC-type domain-containing protein n=1 Tax=Punctularia strigosozonata (strain HHB-11173) TaxID=741275 RepID=R7RZE9_PUNST|nr:uncharacterized protein PUNSTDRAFT_48138 [Punctularia strigosozonata HHB-11173 SS5]EIN03363.1 hypothetical protein PUNSTDRAFT_48138 [Punctularia strigosozonata HHB-11173 SS5]
MPDPTMPPRGSASAPTFDDDPAELGRYFEELEELFLSCKIADDAEKVRHVVRYATAKPASTWKMESAYDAKDYAALKTAIFEMYPGSKPEAQWSREDLRRIVSARAASPISLRNELGSYYRDFKGIAQYLIKKLWLSENEANFLFIDGFTGPLRERLDFQLAVLHPSQNPNEAIPRDKVFAQADHLLSARQGAVFAAELPRTHFPTPAAEYPRGISPAASPSATIAAPAGMIKVEDIQYYISAALAAQQNTRTSSAQVPVTAPTAHHPASQPPLASRPYSNDCHMCGKPGCRVSSCPDGHELVRTGKAIRNEAGRFTLPNGQFLPRHVEAPTMKERFEKFHALYPGSTASDLRGGQRDDPPHMASHFFGKLAAFNEGVTLPATPTPAFEGARIEEIIDEDDDPVQDLLRAQLEHLPSSDPCVQIFEAALEARKQQVADGVKAPRRTSSRLSQKKEVRFSDDSAKSTSSKPSETPAPPVAVPAPGPRPPAQPYQPNGPSVHVPRAPPTAPQFRYQAPIENDANAPNLVKQLLDQPLLVSPRHLLAVSPDVRKELSRHISTKRTQLDSSTTPAPSTSTNDFSQTSSAHFADVDSPRPVPASASNCRLRTIRPVVGGTIQPECILDTGCEMVAMRQDVWEQLKWPLNVDDRITIEVANNTTTQSCGSLKDVPFEIGGLTFNLQVQVVPEAPWEVLMGRAFHTFASCITQDFPDGNQYITITDPVSRRRVQIPTHERSVPRRPHSEDF